MARPEPKVVCAALVGASLLLVASGCRQPPPGGPAAVAIAGPGPSAGKDPPPARRAPEATSDAGLSSIFLGETTVVSHLERLPPVDERIRLSLELVREQPGAFDELRHRMPVLSRTGSVTLSVGPYPVSHDALSPRHRRPSFVIDYDDPAVELAHDEARRLCGPSPTVDQLARFVDRYIEHKDLLRGFDIASQIARRREGDCTEHAVLLTALARSFGFSARVVTGLAIVAVEGKVEGVGHAWTEIHESGRWTVADAALPRELGVRYLPMEVIEEEGQAFARQMLERPNPVLLVRRIVIDATAGP